MTSGRVSPSDLPDSPGQSRPYSPHKLQQNQNQHHHHQQKRALPTNPAHGFPPTARQPPLVASTAQHQLLLHGAAVAAAPSSSSPSAVVVGFQQPPSSANQLPSTATTTTTTTARDGPNLKPLPASFDDDEDFDEAPVVKTYKEEGTPAIFSSRTSLSGLTFTDDEREDGFGKENEAPLVSSETS